MSTAVEYAPHSFGHPMGDTMARPHHGWSQDPYAPRQSSDSRSFFSQPETGRERVQLPGPSSLFAAAAASSSPVSNSSPHMTSHSLPPYASAGRDFPPYSSSGRPSSYYGGDYATPSPVGQTPPQLPAPTMDPQVLPGPLSLRTTIRGPDARFSPTQSPVSSVRSDDFDLAPRYAQQAFSHIPSTPCYRSREPPAYHQQLQQKHHHHHHHQPPAPTSSPPNASLHHSKSAAAAYPTPSSHSIYPPMHPVSPQSGPGRLPAASTSPRTEAKQMSITSLLSGEEAAAPRPSAPAPPLPPPPPAPQTPYRRTTSNASNASTTSKTPMLSPAQSVMTSEYRIHVRQQPVAARSCGFGERDRRVIDPPPIVQLTIDDPEATPEEISMRLRFQFTVLHCSIWNETGEQDNSAMPEDYRQQRRLMGTLVSSPFVGQDENGEEGCFFCFPDLSCRTPGSFRLKFALVVLDPLGMRAGGSSPIMATAMSNVFTVYNAKDFPGMQASTPLTKRLKEQGCLISIKKGNDKTSAAHGREESEEDGEAGNGAGSGKGRKRAKR